MTEASRQPRAPGAPIHCLFPPYIIPHPRFVPALLSPRFDFASPMKQTIQVSYDTIVSIGRLPPLNDDGIFNIFSLRECSRILGNVRADPIVELQRM